MYRQRMSGVLTHAQDLLPVRPTGSPVLTALWPLLWRFHFFAGVIVAPFLVVLCLTGIAYALSPQLNDAVYHRQLYVDQVGRNPKPLAAQVQAARGVEPHRKLVSINPPSAPDRTTAVNFATGSTTSSGLDEYRTVYIDPYTGSARGTLHTASGRPPLQEWLREFHGQVHLGDVGRVYSELVASWLPFLASAGLLLWVTRRPRRGADVVVPRRGLRPGRPRLRTWHAVVGTWLSVGVLFISVTGLTWSHFAGARFEALVGALNGSTPEIAAKAPPRPTGGTLIGPDAALQRAHAEGLSGPLEVTPPAGRSGAYVVSEISESWPIQQDQVAVDPSSGATLRRLDFADYPLPAKLTTLGIDAHQGTLFGPFNQLVLITFALGLLFLIGAGYRMWWLRRPQGSIVGRAPLRSAWRGLPRIAVVVGGLAALAVGIALPVFGVSLALFLVLDNVAGRLPGRIG